VKQLTKSNYDAIVIGSGLGGLSCGAYLAKNGCKVLLLEKQAVPGGYASTFKRGDFTFDVGLHLLNAADKGQSTYKFFELYGFSEKMEILKPKDFARLVFPDHDLRFPNGDINKIRALLEEAFPKEKEGIQELFTEITRAYKDTLNLFTSSAPMWLQMLLFPIRYKTLFSMMNKTISQVVDKHLKDERLKTLFFANFISAGLPPSRLNVFALCGEVDFYTSGGYYPKGGNQIIPNSFVEVININGGEVHFNTEVTSIIVNGNKAVGVVTKRGEEFLGTQIISNASAMETFHNLIDKKSLPAKFLARLDRMQPSISAFEVFLGLDESFRQTLKSTDDYEIVVSDTYDQEEDYEWILNGNTEKANFTITLFSNLDKSLAKGDRFVASLLQNHPYSYWKRFEEAYNAGKKEEYNNEKDRLAGILIKRAERVIPELSKHIEVIEIATPLTMRRYTGNHNGAIYGWANTVNQFSPKDRLAKLPIKNLFLSSAWTFPGEGQSTNIACGYQLAKKLIKEANTA